MACALFYTGIDAGIGGCVNTQHHSYPQPRQDLHADVRAPVAALRDCPEADEADRPDDEVLGDVLARRLDGPAGNDRGEGGGDS